jgi:hypothetical protein
MGRKRKNLARRCYEHGNLFEAELLLELMLRYWHHPFADDADYRNNLHSGALEVLREAAKGRRFIQEVPPTQMNFVAAVWYVEWNSITENSDDPTRKRHKWLQNIRKALPSCFCDPDLLN